MGLVEVTGDHSDCAAVPTDHVRTECVVGRVSLDHSIHWFVWEMWQGTEPTQQLQASVCVQADMDDGLSWTPYWLAHIGVRSGVTSVRFLWRPY